MRVIIDRFEGQYAVCEKEDKNMVNIEKEKIPAMAKEGDVLDIKDGLIEINELETIKRNKEMEEITKNLWK
ncbi:MAG: DUF3006 domain-containing protein [Solirubrobacterales bacterium]